MEPERSSNVDPEASALAASLLSMRKSPAPASPATSTVGGSPVPRKETEKGGDMPSIPEEGDPLVCMSTYMFICAIFQYHLSIFLV